MMQLTISLIGMAIVVGLAALSLQVGRVADALEGIRRDHS